MQLLTNSSLPVKHAVSTLKTSVFAVFGACMLATLITSVAVAASPQKITIYGGSGRIGQRIAYEALNRGHLVTVVVRNPDELKEKRERLTVVKGDILDSAGISRQIAAQDVVVSAVNSDDTEFFPTAAKSLLQAVRSTAPMPRLIWIGGASSLEIAPGKILLDTMTSVPPGAYRGHKLVLDYFRTVSDVPWTFVSPSMHIDPGTRTGKFRVGGDQLLKDDKGESRISMEDFAVAIVDEIEKPQHVRSRFTVGY